MACGLANKEIADTRKFIDAVACGQKFESLHFNHSCADCANIWSDDCLNECWYGPRCHFKRGKSAEVAASTDFYGDGALKG